MTGVWNIAHGLVIIVVWGFALLGPGFVGSALEEFQQLVCGSRNAALSPDYEAARYAVFGLFLLGLAGAWQVSCMTNRWRRRA